MSDRAFVVMQVGPKDSAERQRADEIFEFLIAPTVRDAGLEPYRSDLDISPGAVTSRMLSELLQARIVIADLTGRNPNVFYELGVAHSFARPLILIAESVSSLPFDTKDRAGHRTGRVLSRRPDLRPRRAGQGVPARQPEIGADRWLLATVTSPRRRCQSLRRAACARGPARG